jgi:hypothetical protein
MREVNEKKDIFAKDLKIPVSEFNLNFYDSLQIRKSA